MSDYQAPLEKTIGNALSGKGAHVPMRNLFDGLDWKTAGTRPPGSPHSIYQLISHLKFWQNWVVKWLDGGDPKVPKHASGSWPTRSRPSRAKEWQQAVRGFRKGLDRLARQSRQGDLLAARGKHTRLSMLHAIAAHNSYHGGQVVVLRQMLGKWPPPSGGLTW